MITKTYIVPAISCEHCSATIERELSSLQNVEKVSADAPKKQVTVHADNEEALRAAENLLVEIGYPPQR